MPQRFHNHAIVLLLLLVCAVAYDSMWGFIFRNGYFDELVRIRDVGPHLLPGSNLPIQKVYTGIHLLDYGLAILQPVFANVSDGSAPELSLYMFQFAGQLVPVLTILVVESCREGNKGALIELYALWICAMQAVGYGVVMPIYGACHLMLSSSTADEGTRLLRISSRITSGSRLDMLPWSLLIGYVVPTVLMALPLSITSPKLHQRFVAAWQLFPIWIVTSRFFLARKSTVTIKAHLEEERPTGSKSRSPVPSPELQHLRRLYLLAFTAAALTHWLVILSIAYTALLKPLSKAGSYRAVFLPTFFRTGSPQIRDMVEGAQGLFQYDQYLGSLAANIWAVALHYNACHELMPTGEWRRLAGLVILRGCLAAGPIGPLLLLQWDRDERILGTGASHIEGTSRESRKLQ